MRTTFLAALLSLLAFVSPAFGEETIKLQRDAPTSRPGRNCNARPKQQGPLPPSCDIERVWFADARCAVQIHDLFF